MSPESPPPARRSSGLLALGSAAVLTVYTAGFLRTQEAADALSERRVARQRTTPEPSNGPNVIATTTTTITPMVPLPSGPSAGPDSPAPVSESAFVPPLVPMSTAPPAHASPKMRPAVPAAVAPAVVSTVSAGAAEVSSATSTLPPHAPPQGGAPGVAPGPTPDSLRASPVTDSVAKAPAGWQDGSWTAWGTSRHGDIEVTVLVERGRITAAAISQCLTQYSCSWIAHLQGQVVARQSPEVDNVSGATHSADAFYYAVVAALKQAK